MGSQDNDIRIDIVDVGISCEFTVIDSEAALIIHIGLIHVDFGVRGTFVEFSVIDNVEIILDAQFKLEDAPGNVGLRELTSIAEERAIRDWRSKLIRYLPELTLIVSSRSNCALHYFFLELLDL